MAAVRKHKELEARLGHVFKNRALLKKALTHASVRQASAKRRDNERLVRLWIDKGWEATLREVVAEDPAWIGVYLELTRKERTDPAFRERHRERTSDVLAPTLIEHVRSEQAEGTLRSDQPAEKIAGFVSLVVNGIAVQLGSGEPIRDVDALVAFVRTAVATRD